MGDDDVRVALRRHWAASDTNDFATEHQIYRADAVLDYPQSGERIRSRANIEASRIAQPNAKRFTVALEDQAPGVFLTQEGLFLVIEREARAAADEGLGHLRLRAGTMKRRRRFAYLAMKHCPPSPFRRAHIAAASAFVKPLTRKR